MYLLTRGIDWSLLFYGMVLFLVMAVVSALSGAVVFAVLCSVAALFLCLVLWTRELG